MFFFVVEISYRKHLQYHIKLFYFSGRTKLEPIAIVVLSTIMSLASVFVIIESTQKIIDYAATDAKLSANPRINDSITENQTSQICVDPDTPTVPNVDISSICILVSTIGESMCGYLMFHNKQL